MKHILIAALLLTPVAALCGGRSEANTDGNAPIVGAIRWDAWYGDGGATKAVEASLGQPKYHFRLPWFARVVGEGKVSINGDSQTIVEQEISYAAQAGLNYWAFLDYCDEASDMHIALNRYRAAKDKKGIRYCFVEEGPRLSGLDTSKLKARIASTKIQGWFHHSNNIWN